VIASGNKKPASLAVLQPGTQRAATQAQIAQPPPGSPEQSCARLQVPEVH
jgi:hypothetical protein